MTINSLPQQAINVHPSIGTALVDAHSKETKLFRPSTMRSVTLSNRIIVSPMCMYSSENGYFNDFHVAHYASFAIKGAGMVFIEASAVEPSGRITLEDAGIWCDTHIPVLRQITTLIKSQGSVPALQIGHAGRKASVYSPFHELSGLLLKKEFGGWPDQVIGPSAIALSEDYTVPKEMTEQDMSRVTEKFIKASIRADKAGVEVLEIHSAHGYLIHSFLSGNSNQRTDQYGGSLENRMRFPLKIIQCVRDTWPQHKPLWVRISASDHKNDHGDIGGEDKDGWDINQSVIYARELNKIGVDVIDVSSGGNLAIADYSAGPLYQVPLCHYIKKEANVTTSAVGVITEPKDAEEILQKGKADYVLLAREFLRDSGWVFRAAKELHVQVQWPKQYASADRERYS